MTFKSTIMSKEEGPFSTFSEAFVNFWTRFTAMIEGGTSYQMFEWCWIEGTLDDGSKIPLMWEATRDFAYDIGLLGGHGELQEPVPEIDSSEVELAFLRAKTIATNQAVGAVMAALDELAALVE